MTQHPTTLPPGRIQFHEWCEPPLEPADYTVDVEQTVGHLEYPGEKPEGDKPAAREKSSSREKPPTREELDGVFPSTFDFSVAGPRFRAQ